MQANTSVSGFNSPVIKVNGSSEVYLLGFGIDGNRNNNANPINGIVIQDATDIQLDDVHSGNCYNAACLVQGTGLRLFFNNCEFYNSGEPLLVGSGGGGLGILGSGTISHVQVLRSRIHGNNLGITVLNPTGAGTSYEDFVIAECQVFSNADDGISFFSNKASGGKIVGPRVVNNEVYSNGWLSNGVGIPAGFVAGLLQTGPTASHSGVGIDIISANGLITQPIVVGNRCHENIFDGISIDGHLRATVNTGGTKVTATAGTFNVNWKSGQWVAIGTGYYQISSVSSSTSLTLQTSAGSQLGVSLIGSSSSYGIFADNQSYNNHNVGLFCYFSDHNIFSGNTAYGCGLEGYGLDGCNQTIYSGDRSYGNGTRGLTHRQSGWYVYAANATQLFGIAADDVTASPTQRYGVQIFSNCSNTFIKSSSIFGSTAGVSDSGVNTSYDGWTNLQVTRVITKSNGVSTVKNDVPAIYAGISLSAQAANIGTTVALSAPKQGTYRISGFICVTQAASTSSTMPTVTLGWANANTGVAQTSTVTSASTGNSTTTTFASFSVVVAVALGTNVTYATQSYLSTGATHMQYALTVYVEYVG